jgi:hypothetical protein
MKLRNIIILFFHVTSSFIHNIFRIPHVCSSTLQGEPETIIDPVSNIHINLPSASSFPTAGPRDINIDDYNWSDGEVEWDVFKPHIDTDSENKTKSDNHTNSYRLTKNDIILSFLLDEQLVLR